MRSTSGLHTRSEPAPSLTHARGVYAGKVFPRPWSVLKPGSGLSDIRYRTSSTIGFGRGPGSVSGPRAPSLSPAPAHRLLSAPSPAPAHRRRPPRTTSRTPLLNARTRPLKARVFPGPTDAHPQRMDLLDARTRLPSERARTRADAPPNDAGTRIGDERLSDALGRDPPPNTHSPGRGLQTRPQGREGPTFGAESPPLRALGPQGGTRPRKTGTRPRKTAGWFGGSPRSEPRRRRDGSGALPIRNPPGSTDPGSPQREMLRGRRRAGRLRCP
jgi:hypothetical protein